MKNRLAWPGAPLAPVAAAVGLLYGRIHPINGFVYRVSDIYAWT